MSAADHRTVGELFADSEQGETRYEGVTWTTRSQIAANQLIPLPEPARLGLINHAVDVIATTNQAVAAGDQTDPVKERTAGVPPRLSSSRPHDLAALGPHR